MTEFEKYARLHQGISSLKLQADSRRAAPLSAAELIMRFIRKSIETMIRSGV